MYYLYLLIAIISELSGTIMLKLSDGFAKWEFTIGTLLSYLICFYFLSLSLKGIKLSLAYATWSGIGIILSSLVSFLIFKETLNGWQIFGISLTVVGVIIANLAGD